MSYYNGNMWIIINTIQGETMSNRINAILRKAKPHASPENLDKFRDKLRRIKEDIKRSHKDDDIPEDSGAISKRHLRYQATVLKRGKNFGETVDRLPIQKARPKSVKPNQGFEGPLLFLVKKYGPRLAFKHMSLGQSFKYEFIQFDFNRCGIKNIKTGKFEWEGKENI